MKHIFLKSLIMIPILFLLILPVSLFAWNPPPGSPMANQVHPRLFLTTEPNEIGVSISDINNALASSSSYRKRLQILIDELDNKQWGKSVLVQNSQVSSYNSIAFAFLYAINISSVASKYDDISAKHTTNEYGDKAIEYANHIAANLQAINSESDKHDWSDYLVFHYSSDADGPANIAIAVVADWVHDRVTQHELHNYIDATKNAYDYRYGSNKAYTTVFASAQHFGVLQNGLGFLGIDRSDLDAAHRQTWDSLADLFETNWIDGFQRLMNVMFDGGVSSVEGTSYQQTALRNLTIPIGAISTALDRNWFTDVTWLKYMPNYFLYSLDPRPMDSGVYRWYPIQDSGVESVDIDYRWNWGKNRWHIFNPIIYFLAIGKNSESKELASLMKWIRDESGWISGSDAWTPFMWSCLFDLIMNVDYHTLVTPKSPLELDKPLGINIGNGRFYFLSEHDDHDATAVSFVAPTWNVLSGHTHYNMAAFEIHKYGRLTATRNIAKDMRGNGSKAETRHALFYDSISVYSRSEDIAEGSDSYLARTRKNGNQRTLNPDSSVWQKNGANHVGDVVGDDINNTYYEYVDYDYSNSWHDSKVDYAEREFVYLRTFGGANDEYVVVFDRINTPDEDDTTKLYSLMSHYNVPKLLANNGTEISMVAESYPFYPGSGGRWVDPAGKPAGPTANNTIQLDNKWSENSSHGRLYHKTLLPESFDIVKAGGKGHWFADMRSDDLWSLNSDDLTDEEKNYRGQYSMRVRSTTGKNYDKFLNVMQIGDANTLNKMTTIEKISAKSSNGDMVGAFINDPAKNRIVLFNPYKGTDINKIKSPISYTVNTSTRSFHLLTNIEPKKIFSIYRDGYEIGQETSSSAGTLSFLDDAPAGEFTYSLTASGETPGPQAPNNLRLVP